MNRYLAKTRKKKHKNIHQTDLRVGKGVSDTKSANTDDTSFSTVEETVISTFYEKKRNKESIVIRFFQNFDFRNFFQYLFMFSIPLMIVFTLLGFIMIEKIHDFNQIGNIDQIVYLFNGKLKSLVNIRTFLNQSQSEKMNNFEHFNVSNDLSVLMGEVPRKNKIVYSKLLIWVNHNEAISKIIGRRLKCYFQNISLLDCDQYEEFVELEVLSQDEVSFLYNSSILSVPLKIEIFKKSISDFSKEFFKIEGLIASKGILLFILSLFGSHIYISLMKRKLMKFFTPLNQSQSNT